ncbi:hypothetical protein [Wolinella succinogenes]|uniref:hypothetical protein n=1 Tax=Wolinella succinogenes TaxID=844 RepID=UPI00240A6302|nr:hypothetical protein [Wolinella succinogenes]
MYDLNFYLFVWIALSVIAIPVVLISALMMVIESMGDKRKEEERRALQFQKIDFLLSILDDPKSGVKDYEAALEAFKKYHASLGALDPKEKEFLKRLDFIGKISLMDFWDIDSVAKFRDELVGRNKSLKKEIEQAIGKSLKNRESKDKGKGKK